MKLSNQHKFVELTYQKNNKRSAWEIVQLARHQDRPIPLDYINIIAKDFLELHGDRNFGDDKAIITGFARIGGIKVLVIASNKGQTVRERVACNFGYAYPEGYRKALHKMKLAEKFHLPVLCLIDTPGAYPGIGAEERGQAQAIAVNLVEMSQLKTLIICVITGEGCSGGAIGIGVGDRLAMLQFSYFSVTSPEQCASILWKDTLKASEAAEALKLTSRDVLKLGICDHVIPEPYGGAHCNPQKAAYNLKEYVVKTIRELKAYKIQDLLDTRYKRLRAIGKSFIQ